MAENKYGEPWKFGNTDDDKLMLLDNGDAYVLHTSLDVKIGPPFWIEEQQAKRRRQIHRAKHCVNALAGIEHPEGVGELVEACRKTYKALCTDSRDKSVGPDCVEYHLDGQTMYHAINAMRSALAALGVRHE